MTADRAVDLVLGLLNASVALVVVVRGRRRTGHLVVPLVVLAGFFGLRALSRMATAFGFDDSQVVDVGVDQALDALLIVSLVAILVVIERVLRGVAAIEDAARYRAQEYDRAKRHYTQVVRHRMMNPIAAIRGAALTLRDAPDIADPTRGQLFEAIVDGCEELEHVSLVPERRDDVERDLDAVPRVGEDERRRTPGTD